MKQKAFDFRYNASSALEGKRIFMIIVLLLYMIVSSLFMIVSNYIFLKNFEEIVFIERILIFIFLMSLVYSIFVVVPLSFGFVSISKKIYRKEKTKLGDLFEGFSNYRKVLVLNLLLFVKIFLWTLLFFIPGIIKSYAYSMSMYILSDNPKMSPNEAIKLSVKLMKRNKFRLFCLHFSFIGWYLVSVLTCGILYFYVIPYFQVAQAAFYEELISNQQSVE